MRAIKIDPNTRTVTEIDLPDDSAKVSSVLKKIIGSRVIESITGPDFALILDEEGLLRDPIPPAFQFVDRKFVGVGCLVGLKGKGSSRSFTGVTSSLAEVQLLVEFDVPPATEEDAKIEVKVRSPEEIKPIYFTSDERAYFAGPEHLGSLLPKFLRGNITSIVVATVWDDGEVGGEYHIEGEDKDKLIAHLESIIAVLKQR